MNVRGWLMLGNDGDGLLPDAYCGFWRATVPKASSFKVGQWILWQPAPYQAQVSLVCVEIPIGKMV